MTTSTDLAQADIAALLDDIRSSAARLAVTLDALTDTDARGPSALPGWSRGHVITHLARSADVYRWLLVLARTGTEPGPRADGPTLDRALRDGAGRDAAELTADLRQSLDQLRDEATAMPALRWPTLVTALAGWPHPAWYTLHRARRELETHHVDLGLDYTTVDWPTSYVTWALDETVATLAAREFPVARFEATDVDRSWTLAPSGPAAVGTSRALLAWLAGRGPAGDLLHGLQLPAPLTWPLPPVPGWS